MMTRTFGLFILGISLFGCGSDNDDSSATDNDDAEWHEDAEETIDTGSLAIKLPGEHGSGKATCNMNIVRIVEKRLASVNLTLDVIGKDCDGMGYCENSNMQGGQINYSGGIDGDQAFATMVLNYEPPSDTEEELLWMYNALYKTQPFSRFDMWVDGEAFDALTSDTRGAEDYSKGPHLWETKINIEIDMLQSTDAADQSTPGIQTRGEFSYEGLCEISARYMKL